jgi:hypothetical protein
LLLIDIFEKLCKKPGRLAQPWLHMAMSQNMYCVSRDLVGWLSRGCMAMSQNMYCVSRDLVGWLSRGCMAMSQNMYCVSRDRQVSWSLQCQYKRVLKYTGNCG